MVLVEIEIGSLLSNTFILLFVLATIVYTMHNYLKYKRLYKGKDRHGKSKQSKLTDEVEK